MCSIYFCSLPVRFGSSARSFDWSSDLSRFPHNRVVIENLTRIPKEGWCPIDAQTNNSDDWNLK